MKQVLSAVRRVFAVCIMLAINYALFEPVHGSYSHAAGKNIANPDGSILSAAMMLDHFDYA